MNVLPMLLSDFGKLYLLIAPDLTDLVTLIADFVGWLLKIPVAGPMLAWVLAATFLLSKMGLLSSIVGIFASSVVPLLLTALAEVAPGFAATAAAALGMDTALDANPISLIVIGIAALIAGLALLITHFKQVSSFLNGPLGTAISVAVAVFMPLIGIPMLIIGHWQQILGFFRSLPGWIMDAIKALPGLVLRFFEGLPGDVVRGWTQGIPAMARLFIDLGRTILGWLGDAAMWLFKTGGSILGGLLSGLIGALPNILKFFIELPFRILALLVGAAWWLLKAGWSLITGFFGGMGKAAPSIWSWFISLPGKILGLLTKIPGLLL